jgi:class 3 adenylate cyclase
MLLETIYGALDKIGKRRGIFKVETIGDCYVGVSGVPVPRDDHAITMSRFARDCLAKIHELTLKLEGTLGPGTKELTFRIGLHSGPVTGGVLRGENARFQLFGDTMNTASRLETTGMPNRVHISTATMELLSEAGKAHWARPRESIVFAKGKGKIQTYWLRLNSEKGDSETASSDEEDSSESPDDDDASEDLSAVKKISTRKEKNIEGLIDWNVCILAGLLKKIQASRGEELSSKPSVSHDDSGSISSGNPFDEVKEVIQLPAFKATNVTIRDHGSISLDPKVFAQLRRYVAKVANMYHDIPFHNFEHASHVSMSVVKLLSRVTDPAKKKLTYDNIDSMLHDHSYGINSDPLTQFACVFSAITHDVDHPGVPNDQLVNENTEIASFYQNKSVAEQNSVDLVWELLMEEEFSELRRAIYSGEEEKKRFRQLLVNVVLATDVMDKDLKSLRDARWSKAFTELPNEEARGQTMNRKATIVIEHLIQASDVAHTMQHWEVYRKWNACLFREQYQAYSRGRAEKDPSKSWFQGEIGFFDFYIIPLAKKLHECGSFGVSSKEYLKYALGNRQRWEEQGEKIVSGLVNELVIAELVKKAEVVKKAERGNELGVSEHRRHPVARKSSVTHSGYR